MKPDKITLAIGGDQHGSTLYPTDFLDAPWVAKDGELWLQPNPGDDDTLKLGELKNCILESWNIIGADEDCVDIRGCQSVVFIGRCMSKGSRAFTIKDSQNVVIHCTLTGISQKYDVVIGQYSDQGNSRTEKVLLNIRREDGKSVTVDVWNGDVPSTAPGSGPYVFKKRNKLLVKAWLLIRHLWALIT